MTRAQQSSAQWLQQSRFAVAFTGAGISTESGIPDFRSPGGVWSRTQPVYFQEFLSRAEARTAYWKQKVETHPLFLRAQPNAGHRVLAQWEAAGLVRGLITQNIDGLHQLAGSRQVLELHGTAREVECLHCGARFDADPWVRRFEESQVVPDCPECAGLLKHATISFGQSLSADVLHTAAHWARECDLFLAIGSSLVVTPAAELPRIAAESGARLVIINRDPTPLDRLADLVIREEIGPALEQIESLRAQISDAPAGDDA